jgi:hypothetical protein
VLEAAEVAGDTGNWRSFAGILYPNMMGALDTSSSAAVPTPPEPPTRLVMRAPQEDFTLDHFLFGQLLGLGSYSKVSCNSLLLFLSLSARLSLVAMYYATALIRLSRMRRKVIA